MQNFRLERARMEIHLNLVFLSSQLLNYMYILFHLHRVEIYLWIFTLCSSSNFVGLHTCILIVHLCKLTENFITELWCLKSPGNETWLNLSPALTCSDTKFRHLSEPGELKYEDATTKLSESVCQSLVINSYAKLGDEQIIGLEVIRLENLRGAEINPPGL